MIPDESLAKFCDFADMKFPGGCFSGPGMGQFVSEYRRNVRFLISRVKDDKRRAELLKMLEPPL